MGPTATTGSNGVATFVVSPVATSAYRVMFDAANGFSAVATNDVTVVDHPRVTMSLPTAAPILTSTHITGSVLPVQSGTVVLQRHYSGAWHSISRATLSKTSHYSFTVKLPSYGTFTYRVRRPNDVHQAGNVSAASSVLGVNRTLSSGLSGPDVTALQKRLRALHYDVGAVNSTFGYDTLHAVVAFEKVQGLSRDGVVGTTVWKSLAAPKSPRLRHPLRTGTSVEVDIKHQVLYYAVNGKIARIVDASTGGGYTYQDSNGELSKAITPTGHFSIQYKINKWVKSKLGVLYRPAYFNDAGYAIHGEPSVPSYPASHGCVRITVPAMDRLYSQLTVGMPVWIYS
jgi:hypothetical protein